eukprot:1149842-Pelagomonas_calceolata.AAC.1
MSLKKQNATAQPAGNLAREPGHELGICSLFTLASFFEPKRGPRLQNAKNGLKIVNAKSGCMECM